jgi:hypothetical protein
VILSLEFVLIAGCAGSNLHTRHWRQDEVLASVPSEDVQPAETAQGVKKGRSVVPRSISRLTALSQQSASIGAKLPRAAARMLAGDRDHRCPFPTPTEQTVPGDQETEREALAPLVDLLTEQY